MYSNNHLHGASQPHTEDFLPSKRGKDFRLWLFRRYDPIITGGGLDRTKVMNEPAHLAPFGNDKEFGIINSRIFAHCTRFREGANATVPPGMPFTVRWSVQE